jgi:hypothetical protein
MVLQLVVGGAHEGWYAGVSYLACCSCIKGLAGGVTRTAQTGGSDACTAGGFVRATKGTLSSPLLSASDIPPFAAASFIMVPLHCGAASIRVRRPYSWHVSTANQVRLRSSGAAACKGPHVRAARQMHTSEVYAVTETEGNSLLKLTTAQSQRWLPRGSSRRAALLLHEVQQPYANRQRAPTHVGCRTAQRRPWRGPTGRGGRGAARSQSTAAQLLCLHECRRRQAGRGSPHTLATVSRPVERAVAVSARTRYGALGRLWRVSVTDRTLSGGGPRSRALYH